jgi:hypothetical protein
LVEVRANVPKLRAAAAPFVSMQTGCDCPATLGRSVYVGAAALHGRAVSDRLLIGKSLAQGQSLVSKNGAYELAMQADGNVVLYNRGNGRAIWSTGTYQGGCRGASLIMQTDGNLVVYDGGRRACWSSHTQGHAGASLTLQDDGNAVIYEGSRAIWTSQTEGGYPSGKMDIFAFRDAFVALKAEADKYAAAHPGASAQTDPKFAEFAARATALQRHAPHDALGDALKSAATAVAKVVDKIPIVGTAIHLAEAPFQFAAAVASGARLDHAAMGFMKSQLAGVHDLAPYAATIVSLVPGIGTGIAAAIATGAALAEGKSLSSALEQGLRGAIPGGPIAQAGFDLAMKVAKGENVGMAVLETARNQLPGPAQKAFDVGLAVATGQKLQTVLTKAVTSMAPAQLQSVLASGGAAIAATKGMVETVANLASQEAKDAFKLGAGLLTQVGINEGTLRAVRDKLPAAARQGFDAALKTQEPHLAWLKNVATAPVLQATQAAAQQMANLRELAALPKAELAKLQNLTASEAQKLRDIAAAKVKAAAVAATAKQAADLKKLAALKPADLKSLQSLTPAQAAALRAAAAKIAPHAPEPRVHGAADPAARARAAFVSANALFEAAENDNGKAAELAKRCSELATVARRQSPEAMHAKKALHVLRVVKQWRGGLRKAQADTTATAAANGMVGGLDLPVSPIPAERLAAAGVPAGSF